MKDLLSILPESMHERALRYKFEEDAYHFVLGRLMLKKALEEISVADKLENIAFHKSGKPFLENVFFNISHSANLVVLALSQNGAIGIDIEKIKKIQLEDFKPWFTKNEWNDINQAPDPILKFYWYWTRKESIIKALGINLSSLHNIELDATKDLIIDEEKKWHLKDLDFGQDYVGAICSEVKIENIFIEEMNEFYN